jgi:hypothetical protein
MPAWLHLSAEAAAWEQLARALHEEAPIGGLGSPPEAAFGTLDALTVRQCQPVRHRQAACLDSIAACLLSDCSSVAPSVCCCTCFPGCRAGLLQGKGQSGRGVVLDLMSRRALPCQL